MTPPPFILLPNEYITTESKILCAEQTGKFRVGNSCKMLCLSSCHMCALKHTHNTYELINRTRMSHLSQYSHEDEPRFKISKELKSTWQSKEWGWGVKLLFTIKAELKMHLNSNTLPSKQRLQPLSKLQWGNLK